MKCALYLILFDFWILKFLYANALWKYNAIEHEYLIKYGVFLLPYERRTIINELNKLCIENPHKNHICLKERPLSNPFSKLATDFDTVIISNFDSQLQECIFHKSNSKIKAIHPHEIITRKIHELKTECFTCKTPASISNSWFKNLNNNSSSSSSEKKHTRPRTRMRNPQFDNPKYTRRISQLIGAETLWELGIRGKGVKVGIFDTGISSLHHSHFQNTLNIKDVTDWTYENIPISITTPPSPHNTLNVLNNNKSGNFNNDNNEQLNIDNEHSFEKTEYFDNNLGAKLSKNKFVTTPSAQASSEHLDPSKDLPHKDTLNGFLNKNKGTNNGVRFVSGGIDTLGHGTFVAGVIGGQSTLCPGISPESDLYVFRVFTDSQISYTSWYLDAFNYAILKRLHILNLSIGGPDFLDHPFLDKVWEISANNMIIVSSIGNDGPIAGSLNNPADMIDVIGVGGLTPDNKLAPFSSRGMTTWELPLGYGRVKPDVLTHGIVYGSDIDGGCKVLSGTSVASPVVTGAVSLLISSIFKYLSDNYTDANFDEIKENYINVALIKQVLMGGAERLPSISIFDQGSGKMDLVKSFQLLMSYYNINPFEPQTKFTAKHKKKRNSINENMDDTEGDYEKERKRFLQNSKNNWIPTFSPAYLDAAGANECPYMWPYCSQPLYLTSMPMVINLTILNPTSLTSAIVEKPIWHAYAKENGKYLNVGFSHSTPMVWPWAGWLALVITVNEKGTPIYWEGLSAGQINVSLKGFGPNPASYSLTFPLRLKIIRTPGREKRILWDQYHNLNYPPGYCPRDNLVHKHEPMDWNGDHVHTNFRGFYNHYRKAGYYIEVLSGPFTCFEAKNYGALLLIDSEEEFFPGERTKLVNDVNNHNLSLIVVAEWYNTTIMKRIKFYDENTRHWWVPDTGGSNIPALNELLAPWNISLGDTVWEGLFSLGKHDVEYLSGASLTHFPTCIFSPFISNHSVTSAASLTNQINTPGNVSVNESSWENQNNDSETLFTSYVYTPTMKNQGVNVIFEGFTAPKEVFKELAGTVPILGLLQLNPQPLLNITNPGRIIVFGDANCLDSLRMTKDCFSLFDDLFAYAMTGHLNPELKNVADNYTFPTTVDPSTSIKRLKGNKLFRYSKVIKDPINHENHTIDRHSQNASNNNPLNSNTPSNIYGNVNEVVYKELPECPYSSAYIQNARIGKPLELKFGAQLTRLKHSYGTFLTPAPGQPSAHGLNLDLLSSIKSGFENLKNVVQSKTPTLNNEKPMSKSANLLVTTPMKDKPFNAVDEKKGETFNTDAILGYISKFWTRYIPFTISATPQSHKQQPWTFGAYAKKLFVTSLLLASFLIGLYVILFFAYHMCCICLLPCLGRLYAIFVRYSTAHLNSWFKMISSQSTDSSSNICPGNLKTTSPLLLGQNTVIRFSKMHTAYTYGKTCLQNILLWCSNIVSHYLIKKRKNYGGQDSTEETTKKLKSNINTKNKNRNSTLYAIENDDVDGLLESPLKKVHSGNISFHNNTNNNSNTFGGNKKHHKRKK